MRGGIHEFRIVFLGLEEAERKKKYLETRYPNTMTSHIEEESDPKTGSPLWVLYWLPRKTSQ